MQLPSISVSIKTGHLLACGAQELFGSSPESVPVLKLTNFRPGGPWGFVQLPNMSFSLKTDDSLAGAPRSFLQLRTINFSNKIGNFLALGAQRLFRSSPIQF